MTAPTVPEIDWSGFDKYPPDTIHCVCGAVFHSHYKLVPVQDDMIGVTQKPCPACQSHLGARRVESPPEEWVLTKEDI